MFFFFGIRSTDVLSVILKNLKCIHCGQVDTVAAHYVSRHFHVFWIPIFPIGKRAVTTCGHCKQSLTKREMPPEYRTVVEQYEGQARPRIWQFAGLIIFGLIFIVPFIISLIVWA